MLSLHDDKIYKEKQYKKAQEKLARKEKRKKLIDVFMIFIMCVFVLLFLFAPLTIISYNENVYFCENGFHQCKDPWIPIFNM